MLHSSDFCFYHVASRELLLNGPQSFLCFTTLLQLQLSDGRNTLLQLLLTCCACGLQCSPTLAALPSLLVCVCAWKGLRAPLRLSFPGDRRCRGSTGSPPLTLPFGRAAKGQFQFHRFDPADMRSSVSV